MKFKIKSPNQASFDSIPLTCKRIVEFLNNQPDGDIYDTAGLCAATSINRLTFKSNHNSAHPALSRYRHLIGCKLWWGNRKTIAEFRKKHP